MNMRKVEGHLKQIHSLRELLKDHTSPVDKIRRPEGMRRNRFRQRIKRLKVQEAGLQSAFGDGMRKFINQQQLRK